MAKTLHENTVFSGAMAPVSSLRVVAVLRLALGLTALLGAIVFLEGTSWDIQWHSYIGRDRTLIPPHILMLSGVALSGIAGLLTVLIESWWSRRNQAVEQHGLHFAAIFRGPLGAYVVGYMALLAALAFPLDAYWHTLYGIDVAVWAPFHIMLIASMGIVALGAVYMLISATHLAARADAPGIRRAATLGTVLAQGTVLSLFTLLLVDALVRGNYINLGFMSVTVFPLLSSLLVAFTLVAAAFALPGRWVATRVVACYFILAGIMAVYVQPATDWLLTVEHLAYREAHPVTSNVALQWFLLPLLSALLIDGVMSRSQRKQWSRRKQTLFLTLSALLSGALPIAIIYPLFPAQLAVLLGVGYVASVLLGWAGAYLGVFFGRNVGESMSLLER